MAEGKYEEVRFKVKDDQGKALIWLTEEDKLIVDLKALGYSKQKLAPSIISPQAGEEGSSGK